MHMYVYSPSSMYMCISSTTYSTLKTIVSRHKEIINTNKPAEKKICYYKQTRRLSSLVPGSHPCTTQLHVNVNSRHECESVTDRDSSIKILKLEFVCEFSLEHLGMVGYHKR